MGRLPRPILNTNPAQFPCLTARQPLFGKSGRAFFSADYQCTHVSLVSSLFTHHYDGADHLDFGDKPLVVLLRARDQDWPEGAFGEDLRTQWYAHHEALAHLSSRGVHRVIEHSGHDIEGDQPQAVIDAVDEVLRQLHAKEKP